jgi:hypothetical protein
MKMPPLSPAAGATFGGAICLAILGGMLVIHAWPLWTGDTILMRVDSAASRDVRRGEYVELRIPEGRLFLGDDPSRAPADAVALKRVEPFFPRSASGVEKRRAMRAAVVYVQLEPDANGVLRGISISRTPVAGARNLRGRISRWPGGDVFVVEYGMESLFVEQGSAPEVEKAITAMKGGQVEVALTGSGRARTRAVIAGGRRW